MIVFAVLNGILTRQIFGRSGKIVILAENYNEAATLTGFYLPFVREQRVGVFHGDYTDRKLVAKQSH